MNQNCVDCGKHTDEMSLHGDGRWRCIPCKKKALGRPPRQMTEEEVRAKFLTQVWYTIHYWFKESRVPGTLAKMEGLAFSLLTILDGGSMAIPGFIVAPSSHPEDPEYAKEHAEDWYPTNEKAKVDCDIAGGLHELLNKYQPKDWPTSQEPPPKHPAVDMTTELETNHLIMMRTVLNGFIQAADEFCRDVRPSLFAFLEQSKQTCFMGKFGDTTLRVAKFAHHTLIALYKDGHRFVLRDFRNSEKIGFPPTVIDSAGSANDMLFMVWDAKKNWDPDKLKFDPESEKELARIGRDTPVGGPR